MIPAALKDRLVRGMVSTDTREDVYVFLAMFLSNGARLDDVLEKLHDVEADERGPLLRLLGLPQPAAAMIAECQVAVDNGESFGDAIARWVAPEEAAAIAAGEKTGRLGEACASAIELVKTKQAIVDAVVRGSMYPAALLFAVAGLLWFISVKLAPVFDMLLRGEPATGAIATITQLAAITNNFGLPIVAGAMAMGAATVYALPRLTGPWRMRAEALPALTIVGGAFQIFKAIQGSTFLANLAMLGQSGVRRMDALELLASVANPYLRERIEAAMSGVEDGLNLGRSLEASGYEFPSRRAIKHLMLVDTLGGYEQTLKDFAHRWMERSVKQVKATLAVVGMVVMLAVGLVAGLLVSSMAQVGDLAEMQSQSYTH